MKRRRNIHIPLSSNSVSVVVQQLIAYASSINIQQLHATNILFI
ncbi:MAG TPA: hypothetical protein VK133_01810 [Amoebophilaceae bacterium]|nr:hypothetical protein [Amoebophilaceae bacterium]